MKHMPGYPWCKILAGSDESPTFSTKLGFAIILIKLLKTSLNCIFWLGMANWVVVFAEFVENWWN